MTKALIQAYFDAFNAGDAAGMLACVSDDVEHHVNQGAVRHGRAAFAEFCGHMGVSYREELRDMVILCPTMAPARRQNSPCTVNIS
jgi:ketosteroid isomerase-like protein